MIRLTDFIKAQETISDCQFGFQNGRNTVDAVRCLLNSVWEALEEGEEAQSMMCDLSKAFDCIHHDRLFEKMETYGIRGLPLELIRSYLDNRQQAVYSGGRLSAFQTVRGGVAQGSLIGPLLFCLFINDLPEDISGEVVLFADDTTLIARGQDLETLTNTPNQMLTQAEGWFMNNGLRLNKNKTEKIFFTSKRSVSTINKSSTKLLGITLDTRITWGPHIETLAASLSKAIYAIRRVRQIVGQEAAHMCYHAIFHSRMTYGLELWGRSAHADGIFVQQKKAVRSIVQAGWDAHCRPFFKDLNIMTLPSAYVYQQLLRARREVGSLISRSDASGRNLRGGGRVTIPFHRINTTSQQHHHLALFNSLPDAWRQKPWRRFKTDLKSALTENPSYNIDECVQCLAHLK